MESHAFLILSFIISETVIICSYYGQENDGNDSFIIFLLIDLDMTPWPMLPGLISQMRDLY